MNEQKQPITPPAGREQDDQRATSGGGMGQGRETAGGSKEDSDILGRPGKGIGGSDDTGGASEQPSIPEEGGTPPETDSDSAPVLPVDPKDQGQETA